MFKQPGKIKEQANKEKAESLERALPALLEKLKNFTHELNPHEQAILAEIVESASLHTKYVQAHDEGHDDVIFLKPMSIHATSTMKEEFRHLPESLGLRESSSSSHTPKLTTKGDDN